MAFQYGVYTPGETAKKARRRYETVQAQPFAGLPRQTYTGGSAEKAAAALEKLRRREPFSYDPETDPLYRQARAGINADALRAMRDAAGEAAAKTGGYGNSYAAAAGSRAYAQQAERLNSLLPQLYSLAYERHNSEGDALRRLYDAEIEADEREYDRARDGADDYRRDRAFYYEAAKNEEDRDYERWSDAEERAYRDWLRRLGLKY